MVIHTGVNDIDTEDGNKVAENLIGIVKLIKNSGGAAVAGALRTTLPLGPLVCEPFIKIRKKQRWFTKKRSFFSVLLK